MKTSRNYIIGLILLILGFDILMETLGTGIDLGILIGPLILFGIGIILYQKNMRMIGGFFLLLSAIALFDNVFHIDIGGLVIAAIFVYFGYRMINGKKKEVKVERENAPEPEPNLEPENDPIDQEIEKIRQENLKKDPQHQVELHTPSRDQSHSEQTNREKTYRGKETTTPTFKSSLLGDFHLMNQRFELKDMNIWHGIGDVKIDLSKALIAEGETVLIINGWIGDIDIYIPYDLDVSVNATVTVGDLDILGYQQGGINRHIAVSTRDYQTSTRRVKIMLSLFIGDIDVRYI
ncbi:MAG: hypothetical protein H0Z33_06720 [Bacillaceae bacterium]|nr:hypothetical protein [Bacillaceae bacterium]